MNAKDIPHMELVALSKLINHFSGYLQNSYFYFYFNNTDYTEALAQCFPTYKSWYPETTPEWSLHVATVL